MIWLEDFPCGGQLETCARERYWIEHYKYNLNKVKPGRTREEWIQDKQGKIKEHKREYYKKNTERFKECRKDNAEKIHKRNEEWQQENQELKKLYYQDHQEEILERAKKHRQINQCSSNKTKSM